MLRAASARMMVRPAVATRQFSGAIDAMYKQQIEKIASKPESGPDDDMISAMAALKEKSVMDQTGAVKAADAKTAEMLEGMPAWVDSPALEAEYNKLKAAAPATSSSSAYYPAAALEVEALAANQALLHKAYATVSK